MNANGIYKYSIIILLFTLLGTTKGLLAQTFNDQVIINQVNNKYPNYEVTTYQGIFSGGHPHIWMQNIGGTNTNRLPTTANTTLGAIIYAGYDGQSNVQIGRLSVSSVGAFSPGNYATKMHFYIGGTTTCCGQERMTIDGMTGNVGIGITNPGSKLHVSNGSSGGITHTFSDLTIEDDDQVMINLLSLNTKNGYYGFSDQDDDFVGGIQYEHDKDLMRFRVNNRDVGDMVINSSGNVGIGTTNPGTWKLAVNGNIRAMEVKVETGWSDFVFEPGYALPTLEEVERHIQEKGHLPEIPSAAEVAQNGIFLGEMDAKLLQKIEELTLYTIEQEKKLSELENLREENARQRENIEALEKRLVRLERLIHRDE